MNGCLPVFTAVVSWIWLGQRTNTFQVIRYAFIFTGVILIGVEGVASFNGGSTWLGDALFPTATTAFAVLMVATKVWKISPVQIVFAATLVGGLLYVPVWLFYLDSNLTTAPATEIVLQGAYQGAVPSVLGITLLGVAIRNIGSGVASVSLSGVPAVAALLAIPALGELLDHATLIGIALVSVGALPFFSAC